MRIGVIIDNELNSDIRVLREIKILKEHGHEIFALCYAFSSHADKEINGIRISRIHLKRWIKNSLFFFMNIFPFYELLWARAIKEFIKTNRIEILHVHDLYMSGAAYKGILKSASEIPLVLDLHENYPFTVTTYNWTKGFPRHLIARPQAWQRKEKEYLRYADKIVTLSSHYRDLLIEKYPGLSGKEFAVMPNVPDLSQLNLNDKTPFKSPFKKCAPILFYYGVVAERRGIFDVLNVMNELADESFALNFLLIGPADKKDRPQLLSLISNEKIADRIHYIPWIDFSQFWSWLEVCDICIAPLHKNPQHESGVANKVFDYMLGKKPVIVSDCAPQKKLIEEYNCGLVFSDPAGMKEAIKKLAQDPQLRNNIGENGHRAILNDYNAERFKTNLLQLFK